MFVFISALSAGRHDATLWSLPWMSASALKCNVTQLCTFLFTFTFIHFFSPFCKEEIPYIKKPA